MLQCHTKRSGAVYCDDRAALVLDPHTPVMRFLLEATLSRFRFGHDRKRRQAGWSFLFFAAYLPQLQ